MPRTLSMLCVWISAFACGLDTAGAAPTQAEVFAASENHNSARGAVLSLRQDAANGTGAPQLGLAPDYPASLPAWREVQRRFPSNASLFDACANALIAATDEIKRVAPLMVRGSNLAALNAGIKRAKALVSQGDTCIAKADQEGQTQLQGMVTQTTPSTGPASNNRLPGAVDRGGVVPPGGRDTISGGTSGGAPIEPSTVPVLPVVPPKGYRVPEGFRQPTPPNYACYDKDGFPYTVIESPEAEGNHLDRNPRIPPGRVGYDECINPRPPKGCPPMGVRDRYVPITAKDICHPPPASTQPGRMVAVPNAPKPQPKTTLTGQTERICNLQTLAAWINRGYNTTLAVSRIRVVNAKNPNTYVLMLSGMQPQLGKSTNLADAYIAWLNVQALSAYRAAIMDAVAGLPRGSTLILAGHSQGGMEAQSAVENLTHRWGFKVEQVISFGAPTIALKTTGVQYLNVRDVQDPIPMLDRVYDLTSVKVIDAGGGKHLDPWVAHSIYARPESGLIDMPVPLSASLREPCLEVDMGSLERFDTPTFFTRAFTGPQNPVIRNNPSPRNPDLGLVNCFWVSLAQDRYLAEKLPYFAQCERGAPSWDEIERTLANQFGHELLDDHLGPSPQAAIDRHKIGRFGETSVANLQTALRKMGPGARGIVVTAKADGSLSHAFNVSVDANNVPQYFDAQTVVDGRQYFRPPVRVFFYRTH